MRHDSRREGYASSWHVRPKAGVSGTTSNAPADCLPYALLPEDELVPLQVAALIGLCYVLAVAVPEDHEHTPTLSDHVVQKVALAVRS